MLSHRKYAPIHQISVHCEFASLNHLRPGIKKKSPTVVGQFDVEAALRRHLAIPQTRDRRYSIKLTHHQPRCLLDGLLIPWYA
jgi:hypothetical protein